MSSLEDLQQYVTEIETNLCNHLNYNSNNHNELYNKCDITHANISHVYNNLTQPYRNLFNRIDTIKKNIRKHEIEICNHDFERFSEYHNDVYFVCRKCNYEK